MEKILVKGTNLRENMSVQCVKMDEIPSISHKKNELEMQFEQIKKNVTMNNA